MNKNIVLRLASVFFVWFSLFSFAISAEDKQEEASLLPWIAVHDFTVSPELEKKGINGWHLAEKIENELVKKGDYRVVTRAKISKVLKEKNITSGSSIEASSLGGMIGANFIVTGEISLNGNKIILIGKLIDVSKEAGEVEKSFDLSVTGNDVDSAISKLPELYDELAEKLTMSPGEILDEGINAMKSENYRQTVMSFQELKRILPIPKIKDIAENPKYLNIKGGGTASKTPGELLDYGLEQMKKGNEEEAVIAFKGIETFSIFKEAREIYRISEMLKEAELLSEKLKENLEKTVNQAANILAQAKNPQSLDSTKESPESLCDKAIGMLEGVLDNPKLYLSSEEKLKIEAVLDRVKTYRKTLFSGPITGRQWSIPDINLVLIPITAGTFEMGINVSDPEIEKTIDNPSHQVTISRPFWMGKYEVTIEEFLFFLNDIRTNIKLSEDVNKDINWNTSYTPINKSYEMKTGLGSTWGSKNQPMVGINWLAAESFCKWLTDREMKAKRLPKNYTFRLPTEAEWEYSCRGGIKSDYSFTGTELEMDNYSVYEVNSSNKTSDVGKKKPNPFGLHDIHGNVWEWCADWYNGPYVREDITDPIGSSASDDNLKVVRGGAFTSSSSDLKSNTRYSFDYKSSKKNIGFRVVLAPAL